MGRKSNPKQFLKNFLKCFQLRGYLFLISVLTSKFTHKKFQMKKLLFVLALGAFAACGSGDGTSTTTDTSTVVTTDTSTMVTTVTTDTTTKMMDDTTKASVDTLKK